MGIHVLESRKQTMVIKFGKHSSFTKSTIILFILLIVGISLTFDFLWDNSSSAHISIASNWAREITRIFPAPEAKNDQEIEKIKGVKYDKSDVNEGRVPERILSGTFADLPAPDLEWEQMATAPVPRLDGSAIQIKNLFYVFAGYGSLDHVHSHVDIYNFTDNTWCGRFDIPKEMANSHLGMASDGRYIYVISGQYGPQCRGPTARTFVLDTKTKKWEDLPPLPAPRYAAATQLWKGRLHVMGGSKENRHTPSIDHWSLAVKNGKAIENHWQNEVPIPRGGPHRACVADGDRLFVIGGQEGDFMAKPGSPIFKCARRNEVVYGDVYMLDSENKWTVLEAIPKPNSHIESSWIKWNNSIIIMGGTTEKNPVTKRMILVGEVFQFHLDTLKWSVIGKLPYRVKTTMAGFWDGYAYFTSGQRDRGADNPQPRKVLGEMWRTKLGA